MKNTIFLTIIVCILILSGCYDADSSFPTDEPTQIPTQEPTGVPSPVPTEPTTEPTTIPTEEPFNNEAKVLRIDGAAGDNFGYTVGISGDYAIVGAPYVDGSETYNGAAYIYTKSNDTWIAHKKLTASGIDTATYRYFGSAVSISGDYAIVGGPFNAQDAFIFVRNGTSWEEQQKLDGSGILRFGYAVDISGSYAIVGNPSDFNGAGAACLYHRIDTTWSLQIEVIPDNYEYGDNFGKSVGISGDYAIMGAPGDSDYGADSGSAFIYVQSGATWNFHEKLLASDGATDDLFGSAVAIDRDYAVVGAPGNEDLGIDTGAAYVFVRSGTDWVEQEKLTASDGNSMDFFGTSAAISGDYIVAGTKNEMSDTGAAYVFVRNGIDWVEQKKLTASDGATGDEFGFAVGIFGSTVIAGAPYDDDNGDASGAGYFYE